MARAHEIALTLLLAAAAPAAAKAGEPVDLELVLLGDASWSIDSGELALQREGSGSAFADPRVLDAIAQGAIGAIAVAYVEWAASFSTDIVVDWRVIRDRSSAEAFAAALRQAPRRAQGFNAIGPGIALATRMIESNGYDGTRRVIDVSGDGPDLGAPRADEARDKAVAVGITINALAIQVRSESAFSNGISLAAHYAEHVIGGPGAFVAVAKGRESFREAILAKLVREISGGYPPPRLAARPRGAPPG
jgi:hypothetical protein